jgi:hypothetical protein
MKFLVASLKLLTKVKILEVVTLLREPVPAVTLKVVLEAACDS